MKNETGAALKSINKTWRARISGKCTAENCYWSTSN